MQDVVTRLSLPRIGLPTTRPASLPGRVFLWQWGIRPAAQHLPRQRKGVYAGHEQSLHPVPGVNTEHSPMSHQGGELNAAGRLVCPSQYTRSCLILRVVAQDFRHADQVR